MFLPIDVLVMLGQESAHTHVSLSLLVGSYAKMSVNQNQMFYRFILQIKNAFLDVFQLYYDQEDADYLGSPRVRYMSW